MTPSKHEILLRNQTAVARKIYECVPINEPWRAFQIIAELKRAYGTSTDMRVVKGALQDMAQQGLIRRVGDDLYQRVVVEPRPLPVKPIEEIPMTAALTTEVTHKPAIAPSAPVEQPSKTSVDILLELATDIASLSKSLQNMSERLEMVTLTVSQEREADMQVVDKARQIKALLGAL